MKLPPKSSHLLTFQVIEIEWFNLLSVKQYAINRICFLLGVLPKMHYCHALAYRGPWRHK